MKRLLATTLTLALVAPVAPLWAGEKSEKKQCDQSAAVCAEMMKEKLGQRGWVGINMEYDKQIGATVITNVVANSPAERAGFQKGDILEGLNGVDYAEENEELLKEQYGSFRPGKTATFTVGRDGKSHDLKVELESIPEAILAQWIGQHILDYHQEEAALAQKQNKESDKSP
jgi:predicted metalloprotease with PDZ domain